MVTQTNPISQFVETVQRAAFSEALNTWVTLLAMALVLTVLVVGIQQYQIAQLSKAVMIKTRELEAVRPKPRTQQSGPDLAKAEAAKE